MEVRLSDENLLDFDIDMIIGVLKPAYLQKPSWLLVQSSTVEEKVTGIWASNSPGAQSLMTDRNIPECRNIKSRKLLSKANLHSLFSHAILFCQILIRPKSGSAEQTKKPLSLLFPGRQIARTIYGNFALPAPESANSQIIGHSMTSA